MAESDMSNTTASALKPTSFEDLRKFELNGGTITYPNSAPDCPNCKTSVHQVILDYDPVEGDGDLHCTGCGNTVRYRSK